MTAVLFAVLALAGPPRATLDGSPLAVSAWCWAGKCGAPVAVARRPVHVARGATVRVEFAFAPTDVTARVGAAAVALRVRGDEATWTARRGGGVTITAYGARGFVVYVGRLAVR